MPPAASSVVWIDSTSWELEFFGLPSRIPWPANVDPKLANSDPFEMNHLLDAIEAMGAEAPEPWGRFLQASEHLDEFGEAVQNSEIVRAYELIDEAVRRRVLRFNKTTRTYALT